MVSSEQKYEAEEPTHNGLPGFLWGASPLLSLMTASIITYGSFCQEDSCGGV